MHSRPGFWQAEYCWDKVPGRMAPICMSSAFTVAILALICSLRMGLLYRRPSVLFLSGLSTPYFALISCQSGATHRSGADTLRLRRSGPPKYRLRSG
jgi:hypothetical protein